MHGVCDFVCGLASLRSSYLTANLGANTFDESSAEADDWFSANLVKGLDPSGLFDLALVGPWFCASPFKGSVSGTKSSRFIVENCFGLKAPRDGHGSSDGRLIISGRETSGFLFFLSLLGAVGFLLAAVGGLLVAGLLVAESGLLLSREYRDEAMLSQRDEAMLSQRDEAMLEQRDRDDRDRPERLDILDPNSERVAPPAIISSLTC